MDHCEDVKEKDEQIDNLIVSDNVNKHVVGCSPAVMHSTETEDSTYSEESKPIAVNFRLSDNVESFDVTDDLLNEEVHVNIDGIGINSKNDDNKFNKHAGDTKRKCCRIDKFRIFVTIALVVIIGQGCVILSVLFQRKGVLDGTTTKTTKSLPLDLPSTQYDHSETVNEDQLVTFRRQNLSSVSAVLDASSINDESFLLRWKIINDSFALSNGGVQYSNGYFKVSKTGHYIVHVKIALTSGVRNRNGSKKISYYQHCLDAVRNNGEEETLDCNKRSIFTGEKDESVIIKPVVLREGQQIKSTMTNQVVIEKHFPKSYFELFQMC